MGSKYDGIIFPTTEKLEKIKQVEVKEFSDELTQALDGLVRAIKTDNIVRTGDDHGKLGGLSDDDHNIYHNNSRGDARYLYKENTVAFTPDADYEPATKKYVDEVGLWETFGGAIRLKTADEINFQQKEAEQFVIENRTSDPASPVTGQTWFRSDL